jgi:DNA-binding NarL/FixJ family response regulator
MNKRSAPRRTIAAKEERIHFHGKRVVIVDDHPLIRRGLERMIHSGDDFIVCGEAGTAEQGLAVIRQQRPDLAIIDIGLPGRDGIELARELMQEFPTLTVLILSMHEEADYARRALQAGARGYMVKHDAVEGISTALATVLRGELYLSPGIRGTVPLPVPKRKAQAKAKHSRR